MMRTLSALLLACFLTATLHAEEPAEADRSLATELESWLPKVVNTPAQEQSQWDGLSHVLRALKGETQVSDGERANARTTGRTILAVLKQGPTWPVPAPIRLPRAARPPVIDGQVNEAEWRRAYVARGQYAFNSTNLVERPRTTWYATWDEQNLYFAFVCEDSDIIAPPLERDAPVFNYDCVEMFLLTEPRHPVYWELVISPAGAIYDGFNLKKTRGWGADARPELNIAGLKVGHTQSATGYCVEVAVPFRELPGYTRGNRPRPGDTLHWMLVRLDKNRDRFTPYAFQPLLNWGHNLANHAPVILQR